MDDLYPPAPRAPPADLAAPTRRYQLHVASALAGLLLFVAIYLGLIAWLGSIVLTVMWRSGWGVGLLLASPALFVLAFLVSGLMVIRRSAAPNHIEITERDEPVLWAFVRRVADDAGAPRPHKIFLSPDVNAAVFFDLAFWNLIVPTKKNLLIGLGLVNVLTLDEFKAVLAHEFGHFAQRSMGVSRYLYVSWQVIGQVVGARGAFDTILGFISAIDLRVAWIGWILRLVIWSIRSVLDTLFRGLLALERALSREMELQADLVAVTLTGSDSLVHGLHRLTAADEAWGRTLQRASGEIGAGRIPADLYAVQTRTLERLRDVRGEPDYGLVPPRPPEAAGHRVFPDDLALPPRMWSTHPPNREREDNAKRIYLPSTLDPRPAWSLFVDPEARRRQMTAHLLKLAHKAEGEPAPIEATLASVDEIYAHPALSPRYRGLYLGRSPVREVADVAQLVPQVPTADASAVQAALGALYPEELVDQLRQWRDHVTERDTLKALKDGMLEAPGGVVRFRGRELARRELNDAIGLVDQELADDTRRIAGHDRAARVAHRQAARLVGRGWEEHLEGLLGLLHYADHADADLQDAREHLLHVLRVVTADGSVSASELQRLLRAAKQAWDPMQALLEDAGRVAIPADVAEGMGVKTWREALPESFGLGEPAAGNIQAWLDVYDGWCGAFRSAVTALKNTALRALLVAEQKVADAALTGADPGDAPAAGHAPARYATLVPGGERPRVDQLTAWDRFLIADGWVAGGARLGVAVGVLGLTWYATTGLEGADVMVHNGLGVPVVVTIGGKAVDVGPESDRRVTVGGTVIPVRAETEGGELIEAFEVDLSDGVWGDQLYNVARGSVLQQYTVTYGNARERPPVLIGAPRWHAGGEDFVLTTPAASVSTKSGGASRTAVATWDEAAPFDQIGQVTPDDLTAVVVAHATWDPVDSPDYAAWAALSRGLDTPIFEVLAKRLGPPSFDIETGRMQQDVLSPEGKAAVCAAHRQRATEAPEDADAAYLAARCMEDEGAQDEAFVALAARWPAHAWLARAAAITLGERGRWAEAAALTEVAVAGIPGAEYELEGLRVRRMAAVVAGSPMPVSDTVGTPWVELLAAERDAKFGGAQRLAPPTEALVYVAAGELETAVNVRLEAEPHAHILRLAAASDGATAELVAQARALPTGAGLAMATVWAALAVEARDGRPLPDEWLALVRTWAGEDAEKVLVALDGERLRQDPALLDAAVGGVAPAMRGNARMMGLIVLGDAAPAAWRQEAKALLFPWERPYLR